MKTNRISVVIPTYSPDLKMLNQTLNSLTKQSIRPEKVVVVENGVANIKTQEVVTSFGFNYIYEERMGANAARNVGASVCDDGVLFFTDDDCELKHNCLENHLSLHAQGDFVVGGKVELKYLETKPIWFCNHFESMLAKLDWTPQDVFGYVDIDITDTSYKYLVSANLSIRLSSFNKYNGFDEDDGYCGKSLLTPNDEMMLLERCRSSEELRLIFSSECIVDHNIPQYRTTENYMNRRFYGQGVADSKLAIKSPHLKKIEPAIDLDDYNTIITNTLLKHTVWSGHQSNLMNENLTGDKLIDREITRVYMTCYFQYIKGIQDFLEGQVCAF